MAQLADFPRAAQLGFESGKGQAKENPLQGFIKGMLAQYQQKQQMENVMGLEVAKSKIGGMQDLQTLRQKQAIEESGPLYKAQVKATENLATQRTDDKVGEEVKQWAWNEYKKGNRSIDVLKALGMYASPMDTALYNSWTENPTIASESTKPTPKVGGQNWLQKLIGGGAKGKGTYTPEQEKLIQDNMAAHKRTRDEVITALKGKGKL